MGGSDNCKRVFITLDWLIEALAHPAALKRRFVTDSIDSIFYQLARGAKRSE